MPNKQNPIDTDPNIDALAQQEAELQNKIKEMKNFLEEAPAKLKQAEQDRMQTLPAPDEISERRREKEFFDRLSRGELKNERRHQAKNGVLLVLLLIAIVSMSLWIYRQLGN